jgi:hypothetical protein
VLVVGSEDGSYGVDAVAAGAAKGSLFAAHNVVWGTAGVSALWAGASVPTSAAAATTLTLVSNGVAHTSVNAGKLASHPASVVVVGNAGKELKDVLSLNESQAAKLDSRIKVCRRDPWACRCGYTSDALSLMVCGGDCRTTT